MPSQIEIAAKLYENGDLKKADLICCEILNHDQFDTTAILLRGIIAYQEKKYVDAINLLEPANDLIQNNCTILFTLAASYENLQQFEIAAKLYREICVLTPENMQARQQLAGTLVKLNLFDEALEEYHLLNSANEEDPSLLLAIAKIYSNTKLHEKAYVYLRKLASCSPKKADIWNDAGLLYKILNDVDNAIMCFIKALSIDKDHTNSHLNIASILHDAGELQKAKTYYQQAINSSSIKPDALSRAYYNLALICLSDGDFLQGWKLLVNRPKSFSDIPTLSEIRNKRILLQGEEGLGDEVLFLRFVPQLKQQGASIEYIGSEKLFPILSQLNIFDRLHNIAPDDTYFDYKISIMDLPFILKCDDVGLTPPIKLAADLNLQHDIFEKIEKKKPSTLLGLTWRAGANNVKEKYLTKEVPLETLCSFLETFTGTIVILQRDPTSDEIEYLKTTFEGNIIDASSLNNDLALMLKLLEKLDFYFGVSNTNTHLYGSLGKDADVIVPYPGEWRWPNRKTPSPWYSHFNIIHQSSDKTWDNIEAQLPNYLGFDSNRK